MRERNNGSAMVCGSPEPQDNLPMLERTVLPPVPIRRGPWRAGGMPPPVSVCWRSEGCLTTKVSIVRLPHLQQPAWFGA